MEKFYQTLEKPDESGEQVVFSFHQTVPSANNSNGKGYYTAEEVLRMGGGLPNNNNWGTKWDACDPVIVKQDPTEFLLQCNTAWSPPLEWGQKVSKMFPKLTFTIAYCECGMAFYGVWMRNHDKHKTKTKEYLFLQDDYIGFRTQEDGSRVRDDANPEDMEANGRLKDFMEKYSISNTGG